MSDLTHDDPLGVKADYAATLRASSISLVNSHSRRTGESYKETWDHLYARLMEVCGFDADDYKTSHKLKSKIQSLAEQLD